MLLVLSTRQLALLPLFEYESHGDDSTKGGMSLGPRSLPLGPYEDEYDAGSPSNEKLEPGGKKWLPSAAVPALLPLNPENAEAEAFCGSDSDPQ